MGMNVSSSGGYGPYMAFISTSSSAQVAQDTTAGTAGAIETSRTTPIAGTAGSSGTSTSDSTGSLATQDLFQLMTSLVSLISEMMGLLNGTASGNSPFQGALTNQSTGTDTTGASSTPASGATDTAGSSYGTATPSGTGTAPAGTTGSTPIVAADGSQPINAFTASDYKNYLLAGSHGGQTGTAESILSTYADPNSRFAHTGNTQFQAAVAGMYANQFKAYALGVTAAVTPGADINKIASDLTQVQNVKMTPEAEMLSKVAALYRGNLTGANLYDNAKLKGLLQSWGRNDIASQPNVGSQNGDVQSIGGVVKALNEEKDPAIRQAWLQQIFDFKGNTPSSPSGAVPNVQQYQQAINLVRSGQFDQLLEGYLQTQGT